VIVQEQSRGGARVEPMSKVRQKPGKIKNQRHKKNISKIYESLEHKAFENMSMGSHAT
jgi:hypothetical protein